MAQGDSIEVLTQFDKLGLDDQLVLSEELAITGCRGQSYERETLEDSNCFGKGPAILVYYAPALMQRSGKTDPKGAMAVLAAVFRQARELWPLCEEDADKSVTVRIDNLKELDVTSM